MRRVPPRWSGPRPGRPARCRRRPRPGWRPRCSSGCAGWRRGVRHIEPGDGAIEIADPHGIAADRDGRQAAADRDRGGHAAAGAVDPGDLAVRRRHPDRGRVDGEGGRPRVEPDGRLAGGTGGRVVMADRGAILAGYPQAVRVGREGDRLGGHPDRLADLARRGIDADDRAVGGVGHPQHVAGRGDGGRAIAHLDGLDDPPGRDVDPRHRSLAAVGDPDRAIGTAMPFGAWPTSRCGPPPSA